MLMRLLTSILSDLTPKKTKIHLAQHNKHEHLSLKLDELHLAHEFQIKKQEEKEEAKRAREELREQQKLDQEIRAAREKIAKERKHFTTAMRDLQVRRERNYLEENACRHV